VEAESGTAGGGASTHSLSGCSDPASTRVVGALGSVTMSVSVPTAGTYRVQLFYANFDFFGLSAQVSANGGATTSVNLGTTRFGSTCVAAGPTVNLTLNAGTNTIRVAGPGSMLDLYLDKIVVSH
jgi:hypothetical protein